MSRKHSIIVLALFFVVTMVAGCGGGGSSAVPLPLAAPDSTAGNQPGTTGSGSSNPSGATAGTAALAWTAPATNADGTALTDLRGYKVHYGSSPRSYSRTIDVGKVTAYSLQDLAPGSYYITVTAYNAAGTESVFSNEVSKTIL